MKSVLLALTLLLSSSIAAASLADNKRWKEQEELMKNDYLEHFATEQSCGVKMAFEFDKESFKSWKWGTDSAYGYCGNAFDGMRAVCGDEDGKKAVKAKIKKVVCKNGKFDIKISGSTLIFTVESGAANMADKVKDYLMNNL